MDIYELMDLLQTTSQSQRHSTLRQQGSIVQLYFKEHFSSDGMTLPKERFLSLSHRDKP